MESSHESDPHAHDDEGEGYTEQELAMLIGRVSRLAQVDRSILKSLGHANSKRGKRRALALLIGHENDGEIRVWRLRSACEREGLYETRGDRANFTQDMRKDAARGLFTEHTNRHSRELGGCWRLTEKGAELARRYVAAIGDPAERLQSLKKAVNRSIVIRARAPRCPFCREDVTPDDRAVCNCCGNETHATCLAEFVGERTRYSCVLANTTARCHGRYEIKAKPEFIPCPHAGDEDCGCERAATSDGHHDDH